MKSRKNNSVAQGGGTGWKAPAFVVVGYALSLIAALIHLALFNYLHGTAAEGPDQKAPQSYVNTASHLLATVFQVALQASLGAAFVQYLWFTIRKSALRVSIIEKLFFLRSHPHSLFRWSVLRKTPLLFGVAWLIWAIYVAALFPPSALTIKSASHITSAFYNVSTFNPSYIGNGSIADADAHSFDVLTLTNSIEDITYTPSKRSDETAFLSKSKKGSQTVLSSGSLQFGFIASKLQTLVTNVIVNGEAFNIPSPCGANCSYTIMFDGPQFICNSSSSQPKVYSDDQPIYEGKYFTDFTYALDALDTHPTPIDIWTPFASINHSRTNFKIMTWSPVAGASTGELLAIQQIQTCVPWRAQYNLRNSYFNNIQNMEISTTPMEPIVSFYESAIHLEDTPPLYLGSFKKSLNFSTTLVNWSSTDLQRYRDLNLINIINAVVGSLVGSYIAEDWTLSTIPNTTLPGYGNLSWSLDPVWLAPFGTEGLGFSGSAGPHNGTTIVSSKLNDVVRLNLDNGEGPFKDQPTISFTITQDLLNEILKNATISAVVSYGLWNTTTNATISSIISVYNFSAPINLIIPYFLSLVIALPFVIAGILALHRNGVSTTDGGFIQLITTSRSATLEREAATGHLGGKYNLPSHLEDMEVQFGQLVEGRAGLGTKDEVRPLRKGVRYGKHI